MSSDYALNKNLLNHILHINTVKMRMMVFQNVHTFFQVMCQPLSRSVLAAYRASDFGLIWLFPVEANMFQSLLSFCQRFILVHSLKKVIGYPLLLARKQNTVHCLRMLP